MKNTLEIYSDPQHPNTILIIEYQNKKYPFNNYADLGPIVTRHLEGSNSITEYRPMP